MNLFKRCDCADPSHCRHPLWLPFRLRRQRYEESTRTASRQLALSIAQKRRIAALETREGFRPVTVISPRTSRPDVGKLPPLLVLGVAVFSALSTTAAASAQTIQGYVVGAAGTDTATRAGVPKTPYFDGSVFAGVELLILERVGVVVDVSPLVSLGASSIAFNGILHLQIRPEQKLIPHVSAGYAHTTGDREGNGVNLTIGVNYWIWRRVAVRAEFYERVQHSPEREVSYTFGSYTEPAYTERYRVGRFGVSFR
jgi:hypothetical protein